MSQPRVVVGVVGVVVGMQRRRRVRIENEGRRAVGSLRMMRLLLLLLLLLHLMLLMRGDGRWLPQRLRQRRDRQSVAAHRMRRMLRLLLLLLLAGGVHVSAAQPRRER